MRRQPDIERRFCAICEEPFSTAPSDPFNTCSPECEDKQFEDIRAKMIAAAAAVAAAAPQPARERIVDVDILAKIAASARLHESGDYYVVPSSKESKAYKTTPWSCTCPDHQYRGLICKHMSGVSLLCPPAEETVATEDPFRGF